MSEENKNLKNFKEMNNIDIINEKLNSAAQTLTDANAEAKSRLAEQKREKADEERKERLRKEEVERARKEEQRRAKQILAKKEAELAYAESYRKKLREERERAAINAAKQKDLQKKENERKEAERERAERLRMGLMEAERRNAEADTLVGAAETKARENERAALELEARRGEMKDVPSEYRIDGADEAESFVISDAGLELLSETDMGECVTPANEKANVNTSSEPRSEWQKLSSEMLLSAIEEKLKDREKNDSMDYFLTSDSKITEAARVSAYAEGTKDVSAEYLFGSTLDMLKRRSDYSYDYESRRKNAEQFIAKINTVRVPEKDFTTYAPTQSPNPASDERAWTAKTRKRLDKEEQKILKSSEKAARIQRLYSDMLAEEQRNAPKENTKETAPSELDADNKAAANTSYQNDIAASIFDGYDEDEAKIAALKEEKSNLERRILEMEAANREEISRLSEKQSFARRELLKAEFAAKESAYRQQIDALNARLCEMERLHIEQKREIENAISGYESGKAGFIPKSSPEPSYPDGDRKYEDEWLIADYDKYNQSRFDKADIRGEKKHFADFGEDEQILQGYDNRKRYEGEGRAPSGSEYARDFGEGLMIDDYERQTEKASSEKDIDRIHELDVLESEMRAAEGEHNERVMKKKDLKKLLNKSAKREEKLIKSKGRKRSKYERAKDGAKILLLTECLSLEKALLESYISDLKYAVAADSKKHVRIYSKKTDSIADEFNADLEVWRSQTGNDVPSLPSSVSSIVTSGSQTLKIPEIYYSDTDETRKRTRLSRKDIDDMREEQLLLIREEARRERANKKRAETESGINPMKNKPVTKSMMDKDITTVSERIAFRENRYRFVVAASRFHFGAETGKEKRERRTALAKLHKIRSSRKDVIREAKKNNARYLDVSMQDAESVKARFKADRSKMKDLSARMRALLHERDEINERLIALYCEDEKGRAAKATKNKTAELRLRETKRAFKRQMKLYKRVSSYRIPLKKKQKLFDLMNRKVELCTQLAELKYRIKHMSKRADDYGEIRTEIKDTARQLKYTERDILSLSKRLAKSAAKAKNPKRQMLWLLLLIILIAAALIGYFFLKEQILWLLNMFFGPIMGLFS